MRARKKDEIIQVNLRLPRGLHETLVQEAEKARRPLNSEMVVRLEWSLKRDNVDEVLEQAEEMRKRAEEVSNAVREYISSPVGHGPAPRRRGGN